MRTHCTQQYTRLSLLTLEALAAAGQPLNRPLQEPLVITQPTGYAAALRASPGDAASGVTGVTSDASESPAAARPLAVHLLASFIGSVLGSPYCFQQFVTAAADAYDAGLAAAEVLGALGEDEFAQTGGLLPVGGPEPGAARAITRQLFARCGAGGWEGGRCIYCI